ncbi:MAG: hypothetical protein IKT58_00335 [Oscillospiraceae bacterium]|nr:hypothetical protein [Oscillospiraceae bacterium]
MLRRCGACYGSGFLFMVHTALSVSFADSSPKGRAKWLVPACKPTDKLKFVIVHDSLFFTGMPSARLIAWG